MPAFVFTLSESHGVKLHRWNLNGSFWASFLLIGGLIEYIQLHFVWCMCFMHYTKYCFLVLAKALWLQRYYNPILCSFQLSVEIKKAKTKTRFHTMFPLISKMNEFLRICLGKNLMWRHFWKAPRNMLIYIIFVLCSYARGTCMHFHNMKHMFSQI